MRRGHGEVFPFECGPRQRPPRVNQRDAWCARREREREREKEREGGEERRGEGGSAGWRANVRLVDEGGGGSPAQLAEIRLPGRNRGRNCDPRDAIPSFPFPVTSRDAGDSTQLPAASWDLPARDMPGLWDILASLGFALFGWLSNYWEQRSCSLSSMLMRYSSMPWDDPAGLGIIKKQSAFSLAFYLAGDSWRFN